MTMQHLPAKKLYRALLGIACLVPVPGASDRAHAEGDEYALTIADGHDWHFMTGGDVQVDWRDTSNVGVHINPTIDALHERKRAFYTRHAFDDFTIDYRVNLRYNAQGAGRAGAILRAQDPTHYYLVYFPHSGQIYRSKSFFVAIARVDGDEYIRNLKLAWVPNIPAETDRDYDVSVDVRGSRISVRVDGRNALSVTDDTYRSGLVGLAGQGLFYFEHVKVAGTALAAPAWDRDATIVDYSFRLPVDSKYMPSGCIAPNGDVLIGANRTLLRSSDRGRTWTTTQLPEHMAPVHDYGSPMFRTPDDRLVVLNKRSKKLPDQLAQMEASGDKGSVWEQGPAPHIIRHESADSGHTWSQGVVGKVLGNWSDEHRDHSEISQYGNVVQTADGSLVLFCYAGYPRAVGAAAMRAKVRGRSIDIHTWGAYDYKAFAIRSTDGGLTWSAPIEMDQPRAGGTRYAEHDVPRGAITGSFDFTEPYGVAIGTRIMATVRPIYSPYMWQCWSDDSGATWDAASRTTFPGHAQFMIRLDSGAILCAHRFPNLSINVSRDGGLNWDEGTIVADELWAMGCMIEIEPNLVLCVYMEDLLNDDANLLAQFFRVTADTIMPVAPWDITPTPLTDSP